MFKTAAKKLAHSATIPGLAGNPRLQPLQELIAAEKLVYQSLQRLSAGFDRSSEALKEWAIGEGDDLEDTFSACSALLSHWISSLASFAIHIAGIRECLKAVRTREEALDEMHRRRKSLAAKAASTDKKLNKMDIDNKNLRQQTDFLMGLREQIRAMDAGIMNEEASLGDWKRVKAREWMGVLFGGLLECSEKGTVVATSCRNIVGCVPTEKTQPDLPRARYTGKTQVGSLVAEAERKLRNISFVNEVGDKAERRPDDHLVGGIPGQPAPAHPSPPVGSIATSPSTLPNNPPSYPTPDEFGGYGPHLRSRTYTPGQQIHLTPLDELQPISPARSRFSLPPQGGPGITPTHHVQLSQSSITSTPDPAPSYSPPVPVSSF